MRGLGRLSDSPGRALALAGAAGGGAGWLLAGPVAAVVLSAYGSWAVRALIRRGVTRRAQRARRHGLDQLCALAADLRAGVPVLTAAATLNATAPPTASGPAQAVRSSPAPVAVTMTATPSTSGWPTAPARVLPPPSEVAVAVAVAAALPSWAAAGVDRRVGGGAVHGARPTFGGVPRRPPAPETLADGSDPVVGGSWAAPGPGPTATGPATGTPEPDRLGQLARAALRLADRTGAPLADLLERIEADARAADRGLAGAAAQAAGARATAWLLAALPLGGIGLGYGIGVDPVAVLLHTPIGGGCAVAAVVLQLAGLFWAERLGTVPDGNR